MHITAFAQDRGACTAYRIKDPLNKISKLKLAEIHMIDIPNEDTEKEINKADIVYFGRAANDNILGLINKIHTKGKKVAFDLDDSIFDVDPYSQHYARLGIMPINISDDNGEFVPMWEDGKKGFDVLSNRQFQMAFIKILKAVDLVTTTTLPLKKLYNNFNKNVQIVPNSIDMKIWKTEQNMRNDNDIRILYTGAANHQPHMMELLPVLAAIQHKYKNVRLAFVGADWKIIKNNLDYNRVDIYPWVDYEAYPYLLKTINADIGIAVIHDNFFDSCRSAIKYCEYSALGIPTVASNYGPYEREMEDGKTGILVKTDKDWIQGISSLVENKSLCKTLAANALRDVRIKHNLDYVADTWLSTFKGVTDVN
jgi:glycosyltransferase involved in cell wall biosynthesis